MRFTLAWHLLISDMVLLKEIVQAGNPHLRRLLTRRKSSSSIANSVRRQNKKHALNRRSISPKARTFGFARNILANRPYSVAPHFSLPDMFEAKTVKPFPKTVYHPLRTTTDPTPISRPNKGILPNFTPPNRKPYQWLPYPTPQKPYTIPTVPPIFTISTTRYPVWSHPLPGRTSSIIPPAQENILSTTTYKPLISHTINHVRTPSVTTPTMQYVPSSKPTPRRTPLFVQPIGMASSSATSATQYFSWSNPTPTRTPMVIRPALSTSKSTHQRHTTSKIRPQIIFNRRSTSKPSPTMNMRIPSSAKTTTQPSPTMSYLSSKWRTTHRNVWEKWTPHALSPTTGRPISSGSTSQETQRPITTTKLHSTTSSPTIVHRSLPSTPPMSLYENQKSISTPQKGFRTSTTPPKWPIPKPTPLCFTRSSTARLTSKPVVEATKHQTIAKFFRKPTYQTTKLYFPKPTTKSIKAYPTVSYIPYTNWELVTKFVKGTASSVFKEISSANESPTHNSSTVQSLSSELRSKSPTSVYQPTTTANTKRRYSMTHRITSTKARHYDPTSMQTRNFINITHPFLTSVTYTSSSMKDRTLSSNLITSVDWTKGESTVGATQQTDSNAFFIDEDVSTSVNDDDDDESSTVDSTPMYHRRRPGVSPGMINQNLITTRKYLLNPSKRPAILSLITDTLEVLDTITSARNKLFLPNTRQNHRRTTPQLMTMAETDDKIVSTILPPAKILEMTTTKDEFRLPDDLFEYNPTKVVASFHTDTPAQVTWATDSPSLATSRLTSSATLDITAHIPTSSEFARLTVLPSDISQEIVESTTNISDATKPNHDTVQTTDASTHILPSNDSSKSKFDKGSPTKSPAKFHHTSAPFKISEEMNATMPTSHGHITTQVSTSSNGKGTSSKDQFAVALRVDVWVLLVHVMHDKLPAIQSFTVICQGVVLRHASCLDTNVADFNVFSRTD